MNLQNPTPHFQKVNCITSSLAILHLPGCVALVLGTLRTGEPRQGNTNWFLNETRHFSAKTTTKSGMYVCL